MKTLICSLIIGMTLCSCVVVPDNGTYYPHARYHEVGCMHCWHH